MKNLCKIKTEAQSLNVPIIFDDTATFLSEFVKQNKPCEILEIGTGTGYSGAVMLSSYDKSRLTTIEVDTERFKLAGENLKHFKERVILKNSDALEFLKTCNNKFDLIFLDGPKGQYKSYLKYLINMLNAGGAIIADNIYFHGIAIGKGVVTKGMRSMIKGLHEFIIDVKLLRGFTVTELSVGDGILVITKES